MTDNGLNDDDINGQVIVCLDEPPSMVEVIVPLDTMSSTSLAFSHLFHYFHGEVNEDVQIVAINVAYKDVDDVQSLVIHVFTRPFL